MRGVPKLALVMVAAALLALGASAGVSAGVGGGLSYPAPHAVSLPDDSATGDGVTDGSVACPADFPHPVGGGIRIDGSDPGLDLEVHASNPTASAICKFV